MDKNQIKICSNAKENRIEYFEYSKEDKDWISLADDNHSPFSYEEFLSASLVHKVHDIYKEVVDCYAHPFGVKIIFVGTDEEFKSMKSIGAKDFSEYDIELERGENAEKTSIEKIVMEDMEGSKNVEEYTKQSGTERFDESDLQKMQNIMKNYGINRNEDDYRNLAEDFFSLIPDAFLGKVCNYHIYFTTAALYILREDGTWTVMGYEDLLWEQFSYEKVDDSYEMRMCDSEGNSAIYCDDKKEMEKFYSLLWELKNVKTSGRDEYDQITWEDDDLVLKYMKILVDFHVLGNHDTLAPLIKSVELRYGQEDNDLKKNICQYARSVHKISIEDLKNEVLEFESMLDADEKRLRLALLCKDLVETLQITVCDVHPMNREESIFINWLENRIGIKKKENFIDMLMLPYALMTNKNNEYMDYDKIAQIVSYAHDEQLDIPWHILDNEKIGLWCYLEYLTQEYLSEKKSEDLRNALDLCEFYALSGFYVGLSEFIIEELGEDLLDERQQNAFIGFIASRNIQEYAIEISDLFEGDFIGREEWNQILAQYTCDGDRRTLGDAIFDFFYGEGDK